jgi:hypothetical protein
MRAILLALSVALATLSTPCAAQRTVTPAPTEGDGYVSAAEVCAGGKDLSDQQYVSRPYGDVIHVPAGVPARQLRALQGAVRLRNEHSQGRAQWRVVVGALGPEGLPSEQQGIVYASCAGTSPYQGDSWGYRTPAGGIGVASDRGYTDPGPAAVRLAQTLKELEGEAD